MYQNTTITYSQQILRRVYLEVWLRLFFKVFFIPNCIKIIFFIFLKLFLILPHQNNLKTLKTLLKRKNK